MAIVQANGIDLAYDCFGDEADEAILLIAGLGTQMIRWTVPFCEALAARGYRVIRFDNRDTGCSTHFHHCPPPDFGALAATLGAGRRPTFPIRSTTWLRTLSDCSTPLSLIGRMSSGARWEG